MKEEGSNMKSYPLKILHGEKKQHRQILAKQTNKTWSIFHKRDNHCFFSDKENFRNISVKSFFRFCGALTREKCINGVPRAKKICHYCDTSSKKKKRSQFSGDGLRTVCTYMPLLHRIINILYKHWQVNVFPQKLPVKNKSVRLFWIFFFHFPDRAFHLMTDLSSNCLSRNTFHHVPKDKPSGHFSELLVSFEKN